MSSASLQARIASDPALVQHLLAIKSQLAPDELETLIGAIANSSDDERAKVIAHIKSLPVEAAVTYCRELIKVLRNQGA